MNTPVSFEIAKLLKEKGFNIPVTYNYGKKGELGHVVEDALDLEMANEKRAENYNKYTGTYRQVSAPTIAEVVMWLYEKHGIWINTTSDYNRFISWQYRITSRNKMIGKDGIIYNEGFNSPTKAYSQAIEYTLKNLI